MHKREDDGLRGRIGMAVGAALAAAAVTATGLPAVAGERLEAVRERGVLVCGVNSDVPGFSAQDESGAWHGLDVDYCRALAAALFGDPEAVTFRPLTTEERFTALQAGEVDVLSRNTTWTLSRDAALGLSFAGVIFHDGQGFLVPRDLGAASAQALDGAAVCVQSNTTTQANLADYFETRNMRYDEVLHDRPEDAAQAFFSGECDVLTSDHSQLAAARAGADAAPEDYVILPETISKEPLGPVVRQGDEQFLDIARWVLFALIEAEENGITSQNAVQMRDSSPDPEVQRLLGAEPGLGEALGLSDGWAYDAIRAVGNYGEIYARNVGPETPLGLDRGLNDLWLRGGLMYAMPFR
jgi:general L-amino acid transport system substrate-binding protein